MVTKDDGRNTLSLDDRYIIEPHFAFWKRKNYLELGVKKVEDDFSYSSDENDEWLDKSGLEELMRA
jgi:UDP-N-acetylglucosamine 4,6-dehydratase